MSTITREHLELAAKAAGKKIEFLDDSEFIFSAFIDGVYWSPHTDPADTWQLAADCEVRIDFDAKYVSYLVDERRYREPFDGDTGITAMEAVTLAAAEIGRAMG